MPTNRPQNELAGSSVYELVTTSNDAGDNKRTPYRYFLVGASGVLALVRPDGTEVVTPPLQAGSYFFGEAIRVKTTGVTTAPGGGWAEGVSFGPCVGVDMTHRMPPPPEPDKKRPEQCDLSGR